MTAHPFNNATPGDQKSPGVKKKTYKKHTYYMDLSLTRSEVETILQVVDGHQVLPNKKQCLISFRKKLINAQQVYKLRKACNRRYKD